MAAIKHTRKIFRNSRGQRIVGVLDTPEVRRWNGVVLFVPGFEREIVHYGPIATALCRQGFGVVRMDLTNHVGASDGKIAQFTLDTAADDIHSVLSALKADGAGEIVVVAASLTARSAIRVLSRLPPASGARGLVLLLPVVDVDYTVEKASASFCIDDWRTGKVSDPRQPILVVEHEVDANFARNAIENGWCTVESTRRELAKIHGPVVTICALNDDWVRSSDVEEAMSAPSSAMRRVILLEAASHELARNLPVIRRLTETIIEAAERMAGLAPRPVVHLDFQEVVAIYRRERRWCRSGYEDLSDLTTPDPDTTRNTTPEL